MPSSETQPIKTLRELWTWKPNNTEIDLEMRYPRSATYRMTKSGLNQKDNIYDFVQLPNQTQLPRVLLCHDMKGGYIEDRFDNGCYNLTEEPYRFIHWALIDTFVYFSHHLITIPPKGWIRAAHKNGVEILGTIITEFEEGKNICDEILQTRNTVDQFVNKCCLISLSYHFDGWLLNIENKLNCEQVPNMIYLVKELTKAMHDRVSHDAKVIWYDSVTHLGELKWQNALNENNIEFFDGCDGIYLNYGWRVKPDINDLDNTVEFLERHYGNIDR